MAKHCRQWQALPRFGESGGNAGFPEGLALAAASVRACGVAGKCR